MIIQRTLAMIPSVNILSITFGYIYCLAIWICSFAFPEMSGIYFLLPFNGFLQLFPYQNLTIFWLSSSFLIPVILAFFLFRINRQEHRLLFIFSPLLLLPISSSLIFYHLQINQQLISNVLFYIPVFIFTTIIFNLIQHLSRQNNARDITRFLIVAIGLFFIIFYWLIGWYFTVSCGEHTGDEGHYIIMTKSLYYDHDLELTNNFNPMEIDLINKGHKANLHIAATAKDGKLYSWHPFGVSLYLSIFPPDNLPLRHLLLGLLSGLGSAGLLLLCKYLGVVRRTGLLFVILFSLTPFWGIYSCRVLPEMPGAVLAIWTAVTLFSVKKHPWLTGAIIVICCGYLPYLHPRFTPLSLFGYLFFLFHFFRTKQLSKKWPVILLTTLGLGLLAGLYLYVNSQIYTTASGYPSTSSILFSYPAGIWEILTTNRSVTYITPAFAWMFTASLLLIFPLKNHSKYALFTFISFFTVLLISCSFGGWTGGASVIGRYLLVVCPLFVPLAACMFDRTNPVAKLWFILLAIIPVLHFLLMLLRLPEFHSSFGDPQQFVGHVYNYLRGLLDPFPGTYAPFSLFDKNGFIFPVVLFILTLLLIAPRKKQRYLLIYPVIIVLVAIYWHHPKQPFTWEGLQENKTMKKRVIKNNAQVLMTYNIDYSILKAHKPEQEFSLFDGFNRLIDFQGQYLAAVTTEQAMKGKMENMIFQPDMPANDWSGKPWFWTTFATRFTGSPGTTAFSLTGELTGKVEAHLLIIEMGGEKNHTLLDKKFNTLNGSLTINEKSILHPTGDGLVHILMRLSSGNGTFIGQTIGWSPVNNAILQKTMATFPE